MSDEIERLGGRIDKDNIHCMPCNGDQRHSGGFHPRYGIKLCANEMRNRGHIEDTLTHGIFLPVSSPTEKALD